MNRYVSKSTNEVSGFTFLTNHAHVLLLIAQDPDMRMKEVALKVGITERAVQRIVDDLAATGYLEVYKDGRRNHYVVPHETHLRHPLEKGCTVGDFLNCIRAHCTDPFEEVTAEIGSPS